MKIKFLNQTIEIKSYDRPLPSPFYDINYAYKVIYISSHINIQGDTDKDLLNSVILKGCIDITLREYAGMGSNGNPVYDYILSKVNILNDIYDYKEGKLVLPYKGGNK